MKIVFGKINKGGGISWSVVLYVYLFLCLSKRKRDIIAKVSFLFFGCIQRFKKRKNNALIIIMGGA